MARLVALTVPQPAHLFPFVPILLEFASRGQDVQLCVCARTPGRIPIDGLPVHLVPFPPEAADTGPAVARRRSRWSCSPARPSPR